MNCFIKLSIKYKDNKAKTPKNPNSKIVVIGLSAFWFIHSGAHAFQDYVHSIYYSEMPELSGFVERNDVPPVH